MAGCGEGNKQVDERLRSFVEGLTLNNQRLCISTTQAIGHPGIKNGEISVQVAGHG